MTLFKALTGGAFDHLDWQHSREFDQNSSKKSHAPGRGGWVVLELTDTSIKHIKFVCALVSYILTHYFFYLCVVGGEFPTVNN